LRLIPGWREMGQLIRATIAERVRIAIPCERTAADHNRGYLLIHCIFQCRSAPVAVADGKSTRL
jgi:hypothetical protein